MKILKCVIVLIINTLNIFIINGNRNGQLDVSRNYCFYNIIPIILLINIIFL